MARLQVLSKKEQQELFAVPKLNFTQRSFYFKLSSSIEKTLINFYDDSNKMIFILLYGYFRVSHIFFKVSDFSRDDILYVKKTYNLKFDENDIVSTVRTEQRYRTLIRNYLGIQPYAQVHKVALEDEALKLSNNFIHRKKILYALIDLSKILKIELPSYSEFSNIISHILTQQKSKMLGKLKVYEGDERLKLLDEFIEKNENYKARYNIMFYKRLEHATTKKKMLDSLSRYQLIKNKFYQLQPIIDAVGITPKKAQYYAIWVTKSQTQQVRKKDLLEMHLFLLCFVYHQFLTRSDNLVDRLLLIVQSAKNSSLRSQKESAYANSTNKDKVIESLENSNLSLINDIHLIINHNIFNASDKLKRVQHILDVQTLQLKEIIHQKESVDNAQDRYLFIEHKSVSLQGKLSKLITEVEFDKESSEFDLIEAIEHFKLVDGKITKLSPKAFLEEKEQELIFEEDKFRISLYKVLLFFAISDGIKSRKLNLKYSYRYKNFDSYLIDRTQWNTNKSKLIENHKMQSIRDAKTILESLEKRLEDRYQKTNTRINQELNTNFNFTDKSFILKTPKVIKESDESIAKYFPKESFLSVLEILNGIHQQSGFLGAFSYYNKAHQEKISLDLLIATIVGYGCNINVSKMGKISKGINQNKLDNAKTWYFTEENTKEANDKIVGFMNELDIVKLLRANKEINHTSSDGQKFNMKTSVDSTNAGYSFKYFGTQKGVSVYTFIDESHRLFYSTVINATERESGYVIDGLMHNDIVQSDIHSTDTHGYSEVVFALTHLLGFSFAPRIKNFKEQHIYAFNTPKIYHELGYKIVPKRRIKIKLILENWDEILRFVATIKSKETTASQLLKRLTSYSKHHKLYTALKEFGKIIKSDFLLTYIDDLELRQRIEKQLNKVENSNKFSKAVFFGNNSEFQVATKEEQNIANNCKRLIQNSIICWNYLYMTKKLKEAKDELEKEAIIETIQNSSIVHWSHINFYGEYDFTNLDESDDAEFRGLKDFRLF
jgi:TnpA family transposase